MEAPVLEPWQSALYIAAKLYFDQPAIQNSLDKSHTEDTPERLVKLWQFSFSGCLEDPSAPLKKHFAKGKYDEMIHCRSIRIRTMCAHHCKDIVGKCSFAYIPNEHVVGLSKIPRMVDILCRRPQIQEHLTEQIVDTFQQTVEPLGCAVHIRAYHFCMISRGIEERSAFTETTALRGCFKDNPLTRNEFLLALDRSEQVFP